MLVWLYIYKNNRFIVENVDNTEKKKQTKFIPIHHHEKSKYFHMVSKYSARIFNFVRNLPLLRPVLGVPLSIF